jgi:Ser/Thr protein kinase RdoA (MazF antagonist)
MVLKTIIGTEALTQIIWKGYGITITSLHFLQRGWGGDCYKAETPNGESFFIKLHDRSASIDTAASSRVFYLPLLDQLYTKGILLNIPHPIPTLECKYSLCISSGELVITNFIDGKVIGFGPLPEEITVKLSKFIGVLHSSRAQLDLEHPFIERFWVPSNDLFLKIFEGLEAVDAVNQSGRQLLREVLNPHKAEVFAYLERIKKSLMYVENVNKPMVVCHTDLHGANLMTDDNGNLNILDWENALIAPMEHDLIFFAGEENFWDVFWPNYCSKHIDASIDCEILRFYFYRRSLEDVAGLALRILQSDGSAVRDQSDARFLAGILNGLASIDKTISKIQERLRST